MVRRPAGDQPESYLGQRNYGPYPPGAGDEPVTIGQIAYRAAGEAVSSSPRPTLFFHYGAGSAPVQGAEVSADPAGGAGLGGPARPALSTETTEQRADGAATADEPLSFDPLPLSPGGEESPGTPAQPSGTGWAIDTPAKGIIAISLILLIYAIAVTPISPILIAVALDGLGVAAVVKALSDPSGTVSNTNGRPLVAPPLCWSRVPPLNFYQRSPPAQGSSPISTHKGQTIMASSTGT